MRRSTPTCTTALILSLLLQAGQVLSEEVRCCRDCVNSLDCSDIGDYLGIGEDAESFCVNTLTNVLGEQYLVCPDGQGQDVGSGSAMCCDPGQDCGDGKRMNRIESRNTIERYKLK